MYLNWVIYYQTYIRDVSKSITYVTSRKNSLKAFLYPLSSARPTHNFDILEEEGLEKKKWNGTYIPIQVQNSSPF